MSQPDSYNLEERKKENLKRQRKETYGSQIDKVVERETIVLLRRENEC
jgi:hypothetical protein